MNKRITIVDYGAGNLLNVARAIEHCGATVTLASTPEQILGADKLVLPGVGAFTDAMMVLNKRNLVDPIKDYVQSGKALLGICLGMQLLLDSSDEFGLTTGLSFIPGKVVAIPNESPQGIKHKIPHIAWKALYPTPQTADWQHSILQQTSPGSAFYFIHSYMAKVDNPQHCLGECDYNGIKISGVIKKDNITGCQFHPEKSGKNGLKLIEQYLAA